MKVPGGSDREKWLNWIVETCHVSQIERDSYYQRRRQYYLYGQNSQQKVKLNKIKSHLNLVCSFLYSSDGLAYSIAAPPNADDLLVQKYLAIEDEWNEEFRDSGLADCFDQALLWATVYDHDFIKLGWNDRTEHLFGSIVHPAAFGVFREDQADFSAQEAFTHSYVVDYDEACQRLIRAGKRDAIPKLSIVGADSDTGLPETVSRLIISATGGTNLPGNVIGEVNQDYEQMPTFTPRFDTPMVRFDEVYVWDSDANHGHGDWRIFFHVDPDIIISDSKETIDAIKKASGNGKKQPEYESDTNLFLKQEHPFVLVRPYEIFDYFPGDAHIEDLIPLQAWVTERLEQIDEILERQADPPKSFSGFMSMDEAKAEAWGGPGTYVYDQMPSAKAEPHPPQMPEDLFAEYDRIEALFLEQSGLTEILAGRGERNVRGRGHARELQNTGGGRIRRVAVGLETPLVRLGDIGLRLKARNDDEELKIETAEGPIDFTLAQVIGETKHTMRVAGHSHSPLFTAESRELAAILLKAQAIDREWFIRLLNPTARDNLIHALRKRARAEAIERARNPQPPPKSNGRARPRA